MPIHRGLVHSGRLSGVVDLCGALTEKTTVKVYQSVFSASLLHVSRFTCYLYNISSQLWELVTVVVETSVGIVNCEYSFIIFSSLNPVLHFD